MRLRTSLASALLLAACGGGDGPTASAGPPNPPPTPSVGAVAIVHGGRAVTAGDTVYLTARVYDAAGRVLADSSPHWNSMDPAVATVSAAGLVQTLAPGRARISAQSGSRLDTAAITVLPGRYLRFTYAGQASGTFDANGPIRYDADGRFSFLPYVESYDDQRDSPTNFQVQTLSTRSYPTYDSFWMVVTRLESGRPHEFPYTCMLGGRECVPNSFAIGQDDGSQGPGDEEQLMSFIRGAVRLTRVTPRLVEGTFAGEAWRVTPGGGYDSTWTVTVSDGRFSVPRCPTPNHLLEGCPQ